LHEEWIKTQTVLPSAETAAMLFWALLASGQTTMTAPVAKTINTLLGAPSLYIAWRGDKAMRSAFIFLLGVSAAILFIIGLNLIVVPLVLGPASSTLSCDVSKLVRGMSRDQLKIVCGNPQRINRRFFNDLEEQWVFPNGTHVEVGHGLVTSWSQHYSTQGEVK
jgi:hypothetical protein